MDLRESIRSSFMALNGVYRFLYFFLMKKIPIKDVPSGLEEFVFDLEGVELGKYALELPLPSDNKVSPHDLDDSKKNAMQMQISDSADKAMKPYYSVDLSAIELQPLIQRMENIEIQMSQLQSNNPSKIVRSFEKPHTDSSATERQPLNQRMESIENQIQAMDSRFNGVEAKLNGILEALSQTPK
jgi:hypothetical protein